MRDVVTYIIPIRFAEQNDLTLCKYTDPVEEAREGLAPDEAHKIALDDCNLIYLEMDESGWGIVGEPQEGVIVEGPNGPSVDVTGYNEGDYWADGFKGPDTYGIVPVYMIGGKQFPPDADPYPHLA